jgi:hypothetical protein
MPSTSGGSKPGQALLIVVLVVIGVVWPLVNVGPRGPTLVIITPNHGVDLGDLAAIVPLALAIALIRARARGRPPFPSRGPRRPN